MAEIITSEIEIQSGVISSGLTVETGGVVTVLSGGIVTDAEAVNYGYFWIEEGGHISNIHLTHSGDAMVNGGLAEDLTMESGGMADIFSGVMRTGTILNGGYGAIYETGSGLDVAVSAGGRYLVNGGYAENTVVSSGGSFTVQLNSGLADKTTIEAGGHARITSDGQMWETILNGGRLDVISGRILATTLNAGELHVSSGGPELASGYAENTVVNAGSFIVSGTTATDTTLNGGEFIVSGGAAQKTTVKGGSFIATDATVQSTTVSGGSFVASDAEVQSTTVSGGAVQFIGGFSDKTDIFSGTVLVSGGTVQNTTLGSSTGGSIVIPIIGPTFTPFDPHNPIILNPINWDDIILVADGGTATITYGTGGSILLDGGATVYTPEQRETIGYAGYPGQTVNGDEASAGEEEPACRLDILNGGLAVSTTVNSGLMQVFEGGAANETTVKGGTFHVSSGGIANNITMSSGGGGGSFIIVSDTNTYGDGISFNPVPSGSGTPFVTVFEGGVANNITVSGGLLTLSGGTANDVTLAGGTFHVSSGGIANKTTITGGMMSVLNGALANDATLTNGRIQVESGTIRGATVTGGTVRFMEGGTLSGAFTVTANADVYMESGSVIAFDITGMTPGAEAESSGLYYIWGAPSYTLTVSDTQATGVYALCAEAAGFHDAITVQSQLGAQLGTLTVGNTVFLNNQYYTLRVTDNVLNLTVSNEAPARMWDPVMVFVNDAWASLPEGSTVEPVAGISATIGVDAFATGRDATNAVAGNGTVVVAGGEASFQYGITRDTAAWYGATVTGSTVMRNGTLTLHAGSTGNDLTVTRDGKLFVNSGATGSTLNVVSGGDLAVSGVAHGVKVYKGGTLTVKAGGVCSDVDISASGTLIVETGGYLTGTGKFAAESSITVNGTINFDLTAISAGNSALFTGNGTNINGAPSFTITVSDSQATGEYSLVDFIPDLDGQFTILNALGEAIGTLTVGTGTIIGGRAYQLRRNGTGISLTITSPEETNVLYVNTDWMELEPGALVGTPSGVAIIGFDAFGDLHAAEEHLTEDRFIVITGGTYASETISVGITMEGDTISDSAITETGSLTLNNSVRASNLTVDGALLMNSFTKASDLTVSGRLVMNDSSEAENITVTGNLVLNGNSKARNLTANEGAIVRGANGNAKLLGAITIGSGATLTGSLKFGEVSELVIDGTWDFDISGSTIGKDALFRADNNALVSFTGTTAQLVITVSATQDFGVYKLASGITGFEDAVFTIVNTAGTELGTITVGESVVIGQNKYTLNLSDSAGLRLTVRGKDSDKSPYVYVNSGWADLEFGAVVNIPDVGNAIYGFNAFSELAGISDFVTDAGTVTVTGGRFSGVGIGHNVFVTGGTITDSVVTGKGALTLRSGSAASGITVSAGNLLAVESGATLTVTSPEFFRSGGIFKMNGGLVRFDLSGSTAGDRAFADAGLFSDAVSFGAVFDEMPRNGRYTLLSGVNDFTGYFKLQLPKQNSSISLGQETSLTYQDNGIDVTLTVGLELSDDASLQLVVNRRVSTVSLNSDWEGLEYGTVIEGTGIYGVNAFSTMEDAWNAVGEGTRPFAITILGGTFMLPETVGDISIPYANPTVMSTRRFFLYGGMIENSTIEKGIEFFLSGDGVAMKDIVVDGELSLPSDRTFSVRNITVNGKLNLSPNENSEYINITVVKGGTLSSGGTFTENIDITVDGTLEFKNTWKDYYFVYSGFSNIRGTPSDYVMKLPDKMDSNKQLILARDVVDFDGSISIYRDSDKWGNISLGKTVLNNYLFNLYLSEGELRLDISYSKLLEVDSAWEGLEYGTVVSVPSSPIMMDLVIGVDAFGNLDEAIEAANGICRIRVRDAGTYSFANVLDTSTIGSGATVYDSSISGSLSIGTARNITVLKGGSLDASYTDSVTVKSGGTLKIDAGQIITGFCSFEEGALVSISGANPISGSAVLDFDVTLIRAGEETPLYQGLSYVEFYQYYTHADVCITVSAEQEDGVYLLATGAAGFDEPYIVRTTDGTRLGTLTAGKKTLINGVKYLVRETDGNLMLTIEAFVPPETVYLNSAWSKLDDDTVVEVLGGTAVIGEDAFGNAASAMSAAADGTKLFIVAGSYKLADITLETTVMNGSSVHDSVVQKSLTVETGASAWNIQLAEGATLTVGADASAKNLQVAAGGTLTVEAGGKLTGWAVFSEDASITVDGTLDFDISTLTAASSALYEGLSYVQGNTSYTITVRAMQTPGFYYLAHGADGFKSAITLTATDGTALGTLRAGISTRIGDALYTLNLGDGILSLSIAPAAETARSDIDGNGISDVLFQYTGGDYQTGYWMNGKDTWLGANMPHSAEWTLLGAYDMDGDGIADSVFVGNTVVNGVKGAYIGYYKGGVDTDDNWVNIHFLENEAENVWLNKIGNLTGNPDKNSIVWHCTGLGALGVWTDGTSEWTSLGAGFDSNWTMVGCGDFDGDGRDSVVMSYMGGVKYYAIGLDGSAVDMGSLNWGGWEVRAIGDFKGDGKDDMILFHKEYGAVVMIADGKLDSYTSIGQLAADDWFIVGCGDYDGDRKDDLLVRQYSSGMLGYYSSGDTSKWVELGRGVDMDWTVIA